MAAQRRYKSVRALTEGTEADWQKWVTDLATLKGWRWSHIPSSKYGAGDNGAPDLCLVRAPRLIFAEVKKKGGKVSHAQWLWLEALGQVKNAGNKGVEVYVWRPDDKAARIQIEAVLAE